MPISISVRLPDNTARALDKLAAALDRPKRSLIVRAVADYVSEHAEYRVALDRLRDAKDAVISGPEMRKRLGRKN